MEAKSQATASKPRSVSDLCRIDAGDSSSFEEGLSSPGADPGKMKGGG